MSESNTLKLLLVHDQVDEANRLVSLLRNAGYKVSPKHVEAEQDLPQLLQNNTWDLILAQYESTTVSMQAIFHNTRRLNRDIPVVTISANPSETLVEGLRLGASDVVGIDEDQHILLVVSRSLYNLSQRRRLRYWKRRYSEAETRCQQLLHNSRDAIALIKEGTYIYTNESYAQLFGHMDPGEMLCLPVIDTIAPEDQEQMKLLLKTLYAEEAWQSKEHSFKGVRADDLPIDIQMDVSQVEYEDEPALQFCISYKAFSQSASIAAPDTPQSQSQDSFTEIRPHKLIEQINGAIRRAAQMSKDSLLMSIRLDQFSHLRDENGIKVTEDLLHKVAQLVHENTTDENTLSRFQRDSFIMLLPNTDADSGLRLAENLCNQVTREIFDVGEQTFAATLSIGLTVISEMVTTVDSAIERCNEAIEKLRAEQPNPEIGNGARLYELEFAPSISEIDANIEVMGRRLLGNDQFELLFQPIISLQGEALPLYEVLIQIKAEASPKDFPVDFITQVFKSDAAAEIDRWVIGQAFNQLTEQQKTNPETTLFINISQASFCNPEFADWLATTFKASKIDPQNLIFQLCEFDVGRHLNQALELVQQLRLLDCQIALSRFGLSIDPMQLLERLSVDFVKLDRQLVDNAQENEDGMEALEKNLNELRANDEHIIVPFIENPSLMPTLWKMGIHYIQGHYLQPPQAHMNYNFNNED